MKSFTILIMTVLLTPLIWLRSSSADAATAGAWTLYPSQATLSSTEVRKPINADGSSSWPAKRGVIPVKFRLFAAPGPVVFQSIFSDGTDPAFPGTNDFSFLSFDPDPEVTFNDVTDLHADYGFTMGNCAGGSLRWSVRVDIGNDGDSSNDGSVFIYYGALPNFTDCTTSSQSGVNLVGQPDLRYDTSQVGGTFYDSYANAQTLVGSLRVVRASLVIDSGWAAGDQKLDISNVTVNDNTFVPLGGEPTRVCEHGQAGASLPSVGIQVTKTSGVGAGPIGGVQSVQRNDDDSQFRRAGCMYIYNLDVSSLGALASRPGTYQVDAVVGGTPASGPAIFELR